MSSKIGQLKPFMIEDKKEGPTNSVSETTANKWKGCILANIKKEEKWLPHISTSWAQKKVPNRGFTGVDAATKCTQVDAMLEYISQYAPNALYRDITKQATSLEAIWTLIRNWAGLKTSGCKQQTYFKVKHSFDPNGELSTTDFFFFLRNAKEDCLLLSENSGGKIKFRGTLSNIYPSSISTSILPKITAYGKAKLPTKSPKPDPSSTEQAATFKTPLQVLHGRLTSRSTLS